MLSGKKIIVAVTGSIAAYKAALLVRLLKKAGAEVQVIMTEAAARFVGELTFSNLSQRPVFMGLWDGTWTEHVHLGEWADLMVVAPATSNTLAKMANGICDNALTAVYLAAKCPTLVAPAMDADMSTHPSYLRNLRLLQEDGVQIIDSEEGFLASGLHGKGRMAEPEAILKRIAQQFRPTQGPLVGKKVLISAGPTREHIDPVRFLSNPSTGTMGYAIAAEAHRRGAEVVLVSGPCSPPIDPGVAPVFIESAADLYAEMTQRAPEADIVIMSAAVADYTPKDRHDQKMKKGKGDLLLEMERTQDVLKQLGQQKPDGQLLIGFALETQNALASAQGKLERKNLDYIVLNTLADKGAGFGTTTNKVTLLHRSGQQVALPLKSKPEVAHDLWDHIASNLEIT